MKHWFTGNRGATLIETLFALVLLGVMATLLFGFINRQGRSFHRFTTAAELHETALFAASEIRALVSTGVIEGVSRCGKRLTLSFNQNRVEVYPLNRNLLVKHKGTANPIAGFVNEAKTLFRWRENEHGRKTVVVTLAFEANGQELLVDFPVVSLIGG